MTETQNCLSRMLRKENCRKVSFLRTQWNGAGIVLSPNRVDYVRQQHGALDHLITNTVS